MDRNATDDRRFAPATERNRTAILDVLGRRLATATDVLEIASGSGEHAVFFQRALPHVTWQPSDIDADSRASIQAWSVHEGVALPAALTLDVTAPSWANGLSADAVICINMIHISPWAATEGLMLGAGSLLNTGGCLILYGPFMIDGQHTAESNHQFDLNFLKARNPEWGIRDLADVEQEAAKNGLMLSETIKMPANNKIAIFQKPT